MSVLILYGSETGNTEELAFHLLTTIQKTFSSQNATQNTTNGHPLEAPSTSKLVELYSNQVSICDIQDFDIKSLVDYRACIFIVSTSGEGDVPTGMKRFWNSLLKRSLSPTCLQQTRHAVFGLGDSSYEKYNAAARKLKKRLEQLGSTELCELGLGDDQAKFSYFQEADVWIDHLLSKLVSEGFCSAPDQIASSNVSSNASSSVPEMNFYRPPVDCKYPVAATASTTPTSIEVGSDLSVYGRPACLKVLENRRLTHVEWSQSVHHLVFELPVDKSTHESHGSDGSFHSSSFSSTEDMPYAAGDVAVVYPENPPALVDRMKALILKFTSASVETEKDSFVQMVQQPDKQNSQLELTDDTILQIKNKLSYARKTRLANMVCSYQDILTLYLDLAGRPKRSFFAGIAPYAQSQEERDKLVELASPAGTDLFFEYCIRERRNFVEVLEDFSSLRVPLSELVALLPVVQPRQYSVASHGGLFPDQVHLCVAVASTRTRHGRLVSGLCSSYLARLQEGDTVRLYIRQGVYQPSNKALSGVSTAVLVGPGTGIAPVRAIVQQRMLDAATTDHTNTLVFFGCRKSTKDYLYEDEWRRLQNFERVLGMKTDVTSSMDHYRSMLRKIWDPSYEKKTDESTNPCFDEASDDRSHNGRSNDIVTTQSFSTKNFFFSVAFSQEDPQRKVYVTENVRVHHQRIRDALLSQSGHVFISGSGKQMPRDVRQALVDALSNPPPSPSSDASAGTSAVQLPSRDEADLLLSTLQRQGKYILDTWS